MQVMSWAAWVFQLVSEMFFLTFADNGCIYSGWNKVLDNYGYLDLQGKFQHLLYIEPFQAISF